MGFFSGVSFWKHIVPLGMFLFTWLASGQNIFDFSIELTRNAEVYVDGLKATLHGLQNFIHKMEKMAYNKEKASAFKGSPGYDASCSFICPKGKKLVPKSGYEPKPNGCGTTSLKIHEEDLPHREMVQCCNTHDICYGTCNADKNSCDRTFLSCLENVCHKKSKSKEIAQGCKSTSRLMHAGVVALGCTPFLDSQKEACICL